MGYFAAKNSSQWDSDLKPLQPKFYYSSVYKNLCLLSAIFAFSVGLTIGILIPLMYFKNPNTNQTETAISKPTISNSSVIRTIFLNNSYGYKNHTKNRFSSVTFVDNFKETKTKEEFVENGIFWGKRVERALPEGYKDKKHELWEDYVKNAVAIKMENGCGRMQNRLVTFQDGLKGCVRYRQNTDQIQGELFSFYLAKILNLPNLAPSTVSVVDLKTPLWQNLRSEIASAQWNSNRPIVMTQFITNLNSANIPSVFKPVERHLNIYDVLNMTKNEVLDDIDLTKNLVELAQWSDLIIFDYLTANLDRIVNNLYNYQWNANIMEAPAHNLARKSDSDLLVFLDNESGLLHGYRLLKKYEIYHSILLENLCLFRRQTVDIIKKLKNKGNIGHLLRDMFEKSNSESVKDILPTIPDKSVKILNERIDKVYNQISKCESVFAKS
ncbi:extracellular serine/threonine protein kinase four-jointed [Diabrotica virgifera virgifera]|uniref:Extracellular serine/threonine protein kinase four-jointed n=1 Tax=Diabrotica virgifera virgifera TaxID=50390 RepID=A0A6P7FWP7_DIAVI|nr:extracellular serine/threonine protein kinase four-jointed [Diabrotica virgifera virgifera]